MLSSGPSYSVGRAVVASPLEARQSRLAILGLLHFARNDDGSASNLNQCCLLPADKRICHHKRINTLVKARNRDWADLDCWHFC